jgi:hypothetical protein
MSLIFFLERELLIVQKLALSDTNRSMIRPRVKVLKMLALCARSDPDLGRRPVSDVSLPEQNASAKEN